MKHQWEIVDGQRKYIASFLSDIEQKGETLMQFQHALNDHDEARNVEQMILDVAESEQTRMSSVPEVPMPPPPPLPNGMYLAESVADSAYDLSQPPSPGKISTSTTEDEVFLDHHGGIPPSTSIPPSSSSLMAPPPPPVANGNGRKDEEDDLADCGYVSMKDAPPALRKSLQMDRNENEVSTSRNEPEVASGGVRENVLGGGDRKERKGQGDEDADPSLPPPPLVEQHEIHCGADMEFPPPPPMAEITGDAKDNIAAIRARFKEQEDKTKEEPRPSTSPPRKRIISLAEIGGDTAKSESRPEVTSPSKSRIAEKIAQLKEQEAAGERELATAGGGAASGQSEYVNRQMVDQAVRRRPPAPARDPNTRLTMIENTSVQRMSYGNGVDIRMVRTRSEEVRIQSQYGTPTYDAPIVGGNFYNDVAYQNAAAMHTYGTIPDVPPPPIQAPPPPPPSQHRLSTAPSIPQALPGAVPIVMQAVPAVPPPPAFAPPPVPPIQPAMNTNNTNNIFMQIPGATARPRSQVLAPDAVPPPPCVAPPPPPQPPPLPGANHVTSSHAFAPQPPPSAFAVPPPPPPVPSMGRIPAPPGVGPMVPMAPPAPNAPPPPPPPSSFGSKPAGGGGGLLDGITSVQLKAASKEKKNSTSEAPMDNLLAELQNFSGRLRPTPKQPKSPTSEAKDEPDSGNEINKFQLKPTKTNATRPESAEDTQQQQQQQQPSPPHAHHNGNNSTQQSNGHHLSPNGTATTSGPPPTTPKAAKLIPAVKPKPGKAKAEIPAVPPMAPPAPPNGVQKTPPPSPPQKAPVAPPAKARQTSPKRPDYSKRISMPPETRPLSPTSMSAMAERTRKVSAPTIQSPVQLPEGYSSMPAWKKAMVDKKMKEAQNKEEAEKKKQEEEQAKWKGVPEWKRKLMEEKERKKAEDDAIKVDKTQVDREEKLKSMPTWKRNIVKKKIGNDEEGLPGVEESSTAL